MFSAYPQGTFHIPTTFKHAQVLTRNVLGAFGLCMGSTRVLCNTMRLPMHLFAPSSPPNSPRTISISEYSSLPNTWMENQLGTSTLLPKPSDTMAFWPRIGLVTDKPTPTRHVLHAFGGGHQTPCFFLGGCPSSLFSILFPQQTVETTHTSLLIITTTVPASIPSQTDVDQRDSTIYQFPSPLTPETISGTVCTSILDFP